MREREFHWSWYLYIGAVAAFCHTLAALFYGWLRG